MSFGIPVRNGLSVSIVTTATLTSGSGAGGGGRRDGGEPTLILDFIGGNVPYGATLNLDFTGQTYSAYTADPAGQGFPNFWAWS
jgi:hypothetical protein